VYPSVISVPVNNHGRPAAAFSTGPQDTAPWCAPGGGPQMTALSSSQPRMARETKITRPQRFRRSQGLSAVSGSGDPFVRRLVIGEALVGLGQERMGDFLQRGVGARDGQREILT
jgi:hypothetical protein